MQRDLKKTKDDIIDGWKNYVFRNPLTEAESLRRTAICVECPLLKNDILDIPRCGVCNCPLAMMTRSKNKECEHPDGSKWK
jgi:hypothetical protein